MAGLELTVAAGEDGLGKEVSWLHVSELVDPTEFLEGGEFLLTLNSTDRAGGSSRVAGGQVRVDVTPPTVTTDKTHTRAINVRDGASASSPFPQNPSTIRLKEASVQPLITRPYSIGPSSSSSNT